MNDTLQSPPVTAPRPRNFKFEEPTPNRMPLHFLLLVVSLPFAVVAMVFSLLFRVFGLQR